MVSKPKINGGRFSSENSFMRLRLTTHNKSQIEGEDSECKFEYHEHENNDPSLQSVQIIEEEEKGEEEEESKYSDLVQ